MSNLIWRGHLAVLLAVGQLLTADTDDAVRPRRGQGDHGQATAEYGLVLLGAAGIALLLAAWATKSGAIGKLFDTVMNAVIGKVK